MAVSSEPSLPPQTLASAEPVNTKDRCRLFGLSGWPLIAALIVLQLALLMVGGTIVPLPEGVPANYVWDDWWFRGLLLAVTATLAWFSRIPMHRSNRVPRIALLLIVPLAVMLVGDLLSISAGVTRGDLIVFTLIGGAFVGIDEELFFRGLILNILGERFSAAKSVLISMVLFSVSHIGGGAGDMVLPIFMGFGLGWVYVMSGRNLWLVCGLHALFDIAQSLPTLTVTPEQPLTMGGVVLMLLGCVTLTIVGFRTWRDRRLDGTAMGAGVAR